MNPVTAPGVDVSALAGISPTIIARLIRSGMLQLPPMQLPIPATTTLSATVSGPTAIKPPAAHHDRPLSLEHHSSVAGAEINMDVSSEDGELHEDTGNMSAAHSSSLWQVNNTLRSSETEVNMSNNGRTAIHSGSQNTTTPPSSVRLRRKESAAEEFVLQMVRAGYTFEQLASHVHHRESLRRLFAKLGLDKSVASERQNNSKRLPYVTPDSNYLPQPMPNPNPKSDTQKSIPSVRSAPVRPRPVNRKDYLARLQAAKTKPSDGHVGDSKPSRSASLPSNPLTTKPLPIKPAVPNYQVPSVTKADKDKLLRERLAAVKAEYAAKNAAKIQAPSAAKSENPHSASNTPAGRPLSSTDAVAAFPHAAEITVNSQQVAREEPHGSEPHEAKQPKVLQQSLAKECSSGLPGLFMHLSPSQEIAGPFLDKLPASHDGIALHNTSTTVTTDSQKTSSPIDTIIPSKSNSSMRKRPVASDFDDFSASKSPAKRLFGQSRSTSGDESIVIENSEDEDEEMTSAEAKLPNETRPVTRSFRNSAPLRDFRSGSEIRQPTSYPGTPGVATPSSSDYQRVVQDIEEMNRKIAALEKRKLAVKTGLSSVKKTATSTLTTTTGDSSSMSITAGPSIDVPSVPDQVQPPESFNSPPSDSPGAVIAQHIDTGDSELGDSRPALTVTPQKPVNKIEEDSNTPDLTTLSGRPPIQSPSASSARRSMQSTKSNNDQDLSKSAADMARVENQDMEEGELSDESISNFYGAEAAQGQTTWISVSPHVSQTLPSTNDNMPNPILDSVSSNSSESEMQISDSDSDLSDGRTRSTPQPSRSLTLKDEVTRHIDPNHEEAGSNGNGISYQPRSLNVPDHGTFETSKDASTDDSTSDTDDYEPQPMSDDGDVPGRSIDSSIDVVAETQISVSEVPIDPSGQDDDVKMIDEEASTKQTEVPWEDPQIRNGVERATNILPSDQTQTRPCEPSPAGYVSALSKFKDFRFHPQYLNFVKGGYRSLTYNHKIDATQPICQYEATGGVCNDMNCPGQHFAAMQLSDTELLKKLCTDNIPVHNTDERATWDAGLSSLIKGLRADNHGSEVELLAAKIVQFRRDFINDPTRILNLG